MKDFEEMTNDEKDELLKQIQNLNVDKEGRGDSFDLFTQSLNELSKTWTDSLKEFNTLYPGYVKDDNSNSIDKEGLSKFTSRIRKKFR